MKRKSITFQRLGDTDRYVVIALGNRIDPQVDSVLEVAEVKQYLALRDTQVSIKGAKR